MKTQLKIAAAALLIAGSVTGASAQAYLGGPESWPVHSFARSAPHVVVTPQARAAYGYAAVNRNPTAVYANGKYIGQDPDPNVRLLLQKDFAHQ